MFPLKKAESHICERYAKDTNLTTSLTINVCPNIYD